MARAVVLALVLLGAAGVRADDKPSKKQGWLAGKQAATATDRATIERALARQAGKPAEAVLNIRNTWTHEVLVVPATGAVAISGEELSRFLRCHFTNQPIVMDLRLLDALVKAARSFQVGRVDIVSGFRAPKYNLMLRKKGRAVARDSQHTMGHAVDFRLPGVPTARLRAWAARLRLGGVGYYPDSRFVHVDVGPVRYWTGE